MDLTLVPIGPGLWTTWQPFSLPQCWPFSWWLGVIMDHYSRRIMGITLFFREPTSQAMRAFLGRTIHATGVAPRHLVTDQGPQFTCKNFEPWCQRKGIRPRFGAIGEHGSIAVIERLILTLKQGIAWLTLVPLRREAFLREIRYLAAWYNSHRPHMTLGGRTPDEVYHRLRPMNRQPRFEPRTHWPRSSPCAKPVTAIAQRQRLLKPGGRLVEPEGGRRVVGRGSGQRRQQQSDVDDDSLHDRCRLRLAARAGSRAGRIVDLRVIQSIIVSYSQGCRKSIVAQPPCGVSS